MATKLLTALGLASAAPDDIEMEMSATIAAGSSAAGGVAGSSSGADGTAAASVKRFFSVQGMTCAACSGTIERALLSTRGVHSAKVALLTERCEVVYDPRVLSDEAIVSEIEDVGFEASVSTTLCKGKVSIVTSEHMSVEKCALAQQVALAQVSVLAAHIRVRPMPPAHHVLEVEYDTATHEASGPGGARPVVLQGALALASPTASPASPPSSAGSLSPHSAASSVSSSSSSTAAPAASLPSSASVAAGAPDSLGRFSIRALVGALRDAGIAVAVVRTDGDMESRKAELRRRREEELLQWRNAFLHSLLFTLPTALLCWVAPLIPPASAALMTPLHRSLSIKAFLLWLLVTPVQFGSGARFYRAAYKSLRHKSANMDVLIALGSSAAYFYSAVVCVLCLTSDSYTGAVFFETAALLISIVLLGRYVEHVAKGRTSEALSVLMGLQASTALLLLMDPLTGAVTGEEEVDANMVQRDDVLLVHRGAKVPCDGVVVSEETSSVDEALLTGESLPVAKCKGSTVIGGTINLEAPLRVRATGVGSETVLSKIVQLVEDAQSSKAPIQAYADYISSVFVPVVVALSLLTFAVWFALCTAGLVPESWKDSAAQSNFLFSFLFAISVLLISCPCSLGLATPTAVMVGTGVGAALGVLFKGGEPLERTGKADIVIFDKTGTLTEGRPSVNAGASELYGLDRLGLCADAWWQVVGSLAHQSEHLMSRAMAAHAREHRGMLALDTVSSFEAQSGGGCGGTVRGMRVLIGNERWLASNGVTLSEDHRARMEAAQRHGNIAVLVAIDGVLAGIVSLCDAVKPEAEGVVRALHLRGIQVFMLTGDNATAARAVGVRVGIPAGRVIAHVTPADKGDVVSRVQDLGLRRTRKKGWFGDSDVVDDAEADAAAARPKLRGADRRRRAVLTADMLVRSVEPGSPLPSSTLLAGGNDARVLHWTPDGAEQEGPDEGDEEIDLEDGGSGSGRDRTLSRSASDSSAATSGSSGGDGSVAVSPHAPVVLFVGDGVNDALALARADVGVAIGSGTDIAVETAQVVLMRSDLSDVVTAIDLSQATLRRIRRNFAWACIYNFMSIPVAAGCLYPLIHVGLPPILAAACMGLSSVSVIVSSLLLKRYRKPVLVDGLEADGAPGLKRPTITARIGARIKSAAAAKRGGRYAFSSIPAATDEDATMELDDLAVPEEVAMAKLAVSPQRNTGAGVSVVASAPSSDSDSSSGSISRSATGASRVEALRSHRLQSPLKSGAPASRRT